MDHLIKNYLSKYYDQHFKGMNIPNVFDQEAFTKFISDQIRQAMPNYKQMTSHVDSNDTEQDEKEDVLMPNFNDHQQNPKETSERTSMNLNQDHTQRPKKIQYNVFETHDFVIVRIPFQHENRLIRKRILVNDYKLLFEHVRGEAMLEIKLPHPVNSETTKYLIRNGILEIQIEKRPSTPWSEFEIIDNF